MSEARAAIPELRSLLVTARRQRDGLARLQPHIKLAAARAEFNGGSPYGSLYLAKAFAFAATFERIQESGAILKDFNAGLVDFPHEHDGRIVYLCWRLGEDELKWWHETDQGFAGRVPIGDNFEKPH